MTPTPAGEAFVLRANAILDDVRRAREEVQQMAGSTQGTMVAGLSFAAHVALLPHSLRRFRNRYPHVFLRFIEGLFPTLEAGLKDGSVDFYAGPRPEAPFPRVSPSRRCSIMTCRSCVARGIHWRGY
jgi:LysR family transcriptional regulator of abg operon